MKRPSLLIIFLTVFIDLIGFGIVLPLLPIYSDMFGASKFEIGLIIASFSAMQFLFAPAWGRLSDRIGRRPVLLISNAGSAVSYALFGLASTMPGQTGLWLLLASRVFAGICGANLSVASAYIADVSPRETRSKSMGLIGVAFGLGFTIGPALGSFSAKMLGLAGPGIVAGSLCAANFLLACVILVESKKPNGEHAATRPKLAQWGHTLRQPQLGLLVGLYFLATFCFASFESTFSLLLYQSPKFGYDQSQVGYLFAYCGLIAVFIQGGAIGRLVKRFGEQQLIFYSLLMMALSLVLLPYISSLGGLLVGLGLLAVGTGINRPPTFGLISLNASSEEQGSALGVAQSAGSLARIIGPIFATTTYGIRPDLIYLICAGISVVAGLLAWQFLCKPRHQLVEGIEKEVSVK
jgi:MFS transporter, DHA1 family, tetracycline resistance protein